MCGLIGFSGPNNYDIDKIKTLIMWNSFERGEDSTGLYSPNNGLKRSLLRGAKFIVSSDKNHQIEDDNFLIGHVRAATVGIVNITNAHPFNRGNCVLAHNGTLKNHYALARKYNLNLGSYSVDSDIICGIISESQSLGVLKEINGAAAMLITDKSNPGTLYVFRNDERPLFRGYIGDNMYISSLEEPLKFIGCDKIQEFKKDCIYTIKDGKIGTNVKKVKNVPYSEPVTVSTTRSNSTYFSHPWAAAFGCWIRAKFTATYTTKSGAKFKLEEGKYYQCTCVDDQNKISIFVPELNYQVTMQNKNFEEWDIPADGDLFIVIENIHRRAYGTSGEPYFKEDEIVRATKVWSDKDISLKHYDSASSTGEVVDKSKVRKLTKKEVDEFTKDDDEQQFPIMSALYGAEQATNEILNGIPLKDENDAIKNPLDLGEPIVTAQTGLSELDDEDLWPDEDDVDTPEDNGFEIIPSEDISSIPQDQNEEDEEENNDWNYECSAEALKTVFDDVIEGLESIYNNFEVIKPSEIKENLKGVIDYLSRERDEVYFSQEEENDAN